MSKDTPPENPSSPSNTDHMTEHTPPPEGPQSIENRLDAHKQKDEAAQQEEQEQPRDGDNIVSLAAAADAKRHEQKAQRMAKMQNAFERFMPINKDSRQTKRLKARKKKKGKKKK